MTARQEVDRPTLAGMVLLLAPLLTMAHEIGGHGSACLLTGGTIEAIGAYYVDCHSATALAGRIVALAGTVADLMVGAVAFLLWRWAQSASLRIFLWMVFTCKLLVAAGYPLFSGVTGIGDWGVGMQGGLGPLPYPWVWRVALALLGLAAYLGVMRLASRTLDAMIGGTEASVRLRRLIPMTLYLGSGAVAIIVGLFNPVGLFILLASAIASTFGGMAGLFNVAFRQPPSEPAREVVLARQPVLIGLGVAAVIAFALVLGQTLDV
ncbi:hypothetical protein [Sphingobium nicotianae]|uniref:Uncharacterized protein n=1 Tax=Sphingobium nicotianae TaxID=2782607 RepID=A0A9X1DCZ8_9SPHN|nr:hypothetical protein [Sphingobium nicotianae]MBT2187900.1 hypothetical protein [Sphingobium nicotianae]